MKVKHLYKQHIKKNKHYVGYTTFYLRITRGGWTIKKAIETPSKNHGGRRYIKGLKEMREGSDKIVSYKCFIMRRLRGWSTSKALYTKLR